jgi:hypothetical protein
VLELIEDALARYLELLRGLGREGFVAAASGTGRPRHLAVECAYEKTWIWMLPPSSGLSSAPEA